MNWCWSELTDKCKYLYSGETHLAKLGGPQKATPLLSSIQRRLADPVERDWWSVWVKITLVKLPLFSAPICIITEKHTPAQITSHHPPHPFFSPGTYVCCVPMIWNYPHRELTKVHFLTLDFNSYNFHQFSTALQFRSLVPLKYHHIKLNLFGKCTNSFLRQFSSTRDDVNIDL